MPVQVRFSILTINFLGLWRCFCQLYVGVCPNQSQFCRQYNQIRKRAPNVFCNKKGCLLGNKKCSLLQARAPFSEVLIVGTHVDLLPKNNRQARADALKHSIVKKYLDNQGFPKIVGNIMVSPVTGENIPELKEMIYSKALKVKDNGENIIGRRVSWTRKKSLPPPPPNFIAVPLWQYFLFIVSLLFASSNYWIFFLFWLRD